MNDAASRAGLVAQFQPGRDLDQTHELYHDDAVLEFPQSGERFFGKASFLEWRKQYPAHVDYGLRRITGHADLWVLEILASYNGSPQMFGVSVVQFRGDRIARESIYVMDGFEPSVARAAWATPFDRLASIPPTSWEDGVPFGIEVDALPADVRGPLPERSGVRL
ncbi:MAG TPA: nuclear transport factor 2 family protein [Candidatus Limnocylindrales bacterium]